MRTARTSAPGPPGFDMSHVHYTWAFIYFRTSNGFDIPQFDKNTNLSVLCILYIIIYSYITCDYTPVVPHKAVAVAEVSKIGNYRRCELL